jgi:hypothetical protein
MNTLTALPGQLRLQLPAPKPGQILRLHQPNHPDLHFEWHPETEKVYVIRLKILPHRGEIVAFGVQDHGAAHNAVLTWLRGYGTAKHEAVHQQQLLL